MTAIVSAPDPAAIEPDATAVINAVEDRSWRIIHIAGHGEPPATVDGRTDLSGVVLSNEAFLGPNGDQVASHHSRTGVRQLLLPGPR